MRKTILWKYLFTARERRLYPRRYKLSNKECLALKHQIRERLKKRRIRYKLTLKCDRIKVRDHTMPGGYRCYNNYYYQ